MIEINLLPERPKRRETRFKNFDLSALKIEKTVFLKIAIVVAVVLAALHSILYIVGALSRSETDLLAKRYNALLTKKAEADALRARKDGMYKKVSAINELMVDRFSWAKKLNALSDSMAPGIWLSELDYYEDAGKAAGHLMLSGYASSMGEEGTALIGKFIKALKDNGAFYSDFSEIELKSIKADKIGGQEVMNFRIDCLFKE